MRRGLAAVLVAVLVLAACGGEEPVPPVADEVLLFTGTRGFRHEDAIAAAAATLPDALAPWGLVTRRSEDPADLEDLAGVAAVVFLYTTGNDLVTPAGRTTLEAFVAAGGGWAGVHSAADTEYEWPFYQQLVVAHFASHPEIQPADVIVEDREHPASAMLPSPWTADDEWYNFLANPRGDGVRILATVDEASYSGGTMGADHPIAWAHERLGGRAFYTGLGHAGERWADPVFVGHVAGGIAWAAGLD